MSERDCYVVVPLLSGACLLLFVVLVTMALTTSSDQRIMIACKERGYWAMGQDVIACKVLARERGE